jgi:tRNA dimethylallyltransferase
MTDAPEPPILLVAGPTASGKSALALRLAEEFGGTIINADSMQLYRDLAVLTARPGSAEEERAPHRLYGVIDAAESCSVGRWRRLALDEIAAARATGRLPILVGGSGLYLHALLRGLAEIPPIPTAERARARALHAQHGGAGFHALLAERDPESAARLVPGDTQRLIRAYEVVVATGRPLGAWQREAGPAVGMAVAAIVLLPPRPGLYAAIDARFVAMFDGGAVAEVEALLARGLGEELPILKAVGVREIQAWLAGQTNREAALIAAQQATRHYAKRQFTWLRHRLPEGEGMAKLTLNAQFSERIFPEIFAFIRHFLLTHPT